MFHALLMIIDLPDPAVPQDINHAPKDLNGEVFDFTFFNLIAYSACRSVS